MHKLEIIRFIINLNLKNHFNFDILSRNDFLIMVHDKVKRAGKSLTTHCFNLYGNIVSLVVVVVHMCT